jgi:hypothetical protein
MKAVQEATLLENLWSSLAMLLASRREVTVSVPKVSFLLRFADESLTEESRPDEARRVFKKGLAARGWRLKEVLPPAGEYCFERYVIVKKGVRWKGKGI